MVEPESVNFQLNGVFVKGSFEKNWSQRSNVGNRRQPHYASAHNEENPHDLHTSGGAGAEEVLVALRINDFVL